LVETPPVSQQPVPPPPLGNLPQKRSKLWIIIIGILILAVGTAVYFVKYHSTSKNSSPNQTSNTTLASAKPQFSFGDSVAGYLTYDAGKFKELSTIGLPTVKSANPDVNTVIVSANVVSYGDSGLYLYDLKTNKAYKLTSGGGTPHIMSDHFVVYGFDEGSGVDKKLGARLLDLNTGENKIVFSATPEEVSDTICCSVSPDGYKLALPQKNKITVWDIRSNTTKDYPATLNPIGEGFSRTAANDYAVEMSYASPAWADNNTVIYADKPATKYVEAGGATTKPAVSSDLFQLDLTTGKSSQLTTDGSGIYDIYTREDGGLIFTNEVTVGAAVNQFSEQSLDNKPEVLAVTTDSFTSLSPKGDKLYLFPVLFKSNGYTVIDTNTKDTSSFNPVPDGITQISQIIPKGWAGDDKIILQILDTATSTNHEYIAIYNTTTDKVEQYATIK